jgi:ABC-type dipeptide/oligopeptide/nickel transport system permease subunit
VSTLALAIAMTFWHRIARAVDETATRLMEDQRAEVIRAIGGSARWVVTRHVLPALVAPLTALTLFLLTTVVPIEAAISFLWGFGATLVGTTSSSHGFWASHPHLWIPTLLLVALATWSTDRLARTCLGGLQARGHPGAAAIATAFSYLAFARDDRGAAPARTRASLLLEQHRRRS